MSNVYGIIVLCLLLFFIATSTVNSASCSSNEYCPNGWTVRRNTTDQSPITCDPMNPKGKCEKPYTCVHSRCGLNFCCVNDVTLKRKLEVEEMERENAENSDEVNDEEL